MALYGSISDNILGCLNLSDIPKKEERQSNSDEHTLALLPSVKGPVFCVWPKLKVITPLVGSMTTKGQMGSQLSE